MCCDKFGFMLLLDLAIDLKSVLKSRKLYDLTKSCTLILTACYPLLSIARPIFPADPLTLANHVCVFLEMCNPQVECILLHKIRIHFTKVVQ